MQHTSLFSSSSDLYFVGPLAGRVVENHPQVAVDGGIAFAKDPVLWVGDGDSGQEPPNAPVLRKTSADETDLTCALRAVSEGEWTRLHLFGFWGKRRDHEWANLGEVCQEWKKRVLSGKSSQAIFYDEQSHTRAFIYSPGEHRFERTGLFSLFTLERGEVSLSGACTYSLDQESLEPFSGRGISNIGHGEVKLVSTVPVIIFEVEDHA